MEFWDKVQKDVSKGLRDGFEVIKVKASELTEEGRKRYRLYDIKSSIHKHMAELGAAVYSLRDSGKTPMSAPKVSGLIKKIAGLEKQLVELDPSLAKKKKAAPKKKARK